MLLLVNPSPTTLTILGLVKSKISKMSNPLVCHQREWWHATSHFTLSRWHDSVSIPPIIL